MALRWHVWRKSGLFAPSADICATTAPRCIRLHGRATMQDNHEINGTYELSGTYMGFPSYVKSSGETAPQYDRWVVVWASCEQPDSCIAFADAAGAEHPAS